MNVAFIGGLGLVLLTSSGAQGVVVVNDADGVLGRTRAPIATAVRLSKSERRAAVEARLHLTVLSTLSL